MYYDSLPLAFDSVDPVLNCWEKLEEMLDQQSGISHSDQLYSEYERDMTEYYITMIRTQSESESGFHLEAMLPIWCFVSLQARESIVARASKNTGVVVGRRLVSVTMETEEDAMNMALYMFGILFPRAASLRTLRREFLFTEGNSVRSAVIAQFFYGRRCYSELNPWNGEELRYERFIHKG